jgi:hypothetical protein
MDDRLMDAAELTALIASLEKLRASGYARVSYEGRTVEYRGIADIDRALAGLRAQLATANGSTPVRRIYAYQDGKGL